VNLSELPRMLGTTRVRSELVWLLVSLDRELDREYARTNPGPPGDSGTRAELPGIAYPRTF
jgi:hypothetical protein